jgi:hypothetical protein
MSNLSLPLGAKGSGRARYAAAMDMYQQGLISPAALEVYRIASARDGQDPAPMLTEFGMKPIMTPAYAADHIARLIDEADRYIATLPGRGVAEVRAGLNQARAGLVQVTPQTNTVVDQHLDAALAPLRATHLALAQAIEAAAPHLTWITYDRYPPDEIGADFAQGHAYASLIGEAGNLVARDYDLGIFLIAPHVLYRDHHHAAPELYAPLTGPHGWRFGPHTPLIIKPAHHPVWNDAHRPHMTKVGPTPFLALFGWIRDVTQAAEVIPAPDWPALEALRLDPLA